MRNDKQTRSIAYRLAAFVLAVSLSLFAAGSAAAEVPPVRFGADSAEHTLLGHVAIQRDPTGQRTLADVVFGTDRLDFEPAPGSLLFGYTRDTIWLKTTVRLPPGFQDDLYVWFRPNFLDSIEVYAPTTADPRAASDFRMVQLGDHSKAQQNTFSFPFQGAKIPPPNTDTFELFIRIKTTSSLMLEGWLGSYTAFLKNAIATSAFFGFSLTFFLVLSVIMFINWRLSKAPILLIFSAFLFSQSVNVLPLSGLGLHALARTLPGLQDQVTQFALIICHALGLMLLAEQTDIRKGQPIFLWIYRLSLGYVLLGLPLSLLGYYREFIFQEFFVMLVMFLVFTYKNVAKAFQERDDARTAAIACIVYAFFAIPYHAVLLGFFVPTTRVVGLLLLGNFVFVCLMSVALMQRTSASERLRRESELLRISRQAERAAMDLAASRTAELVTAKEAAERALAQERAAQAEQLRFVDVVTHQYQTPLAVIRSSVTALRHAISGRDDANRRRIAQIDEAVRRLVEIMDVSLHRSRMDGYAGRANRSRVPIVATLTGIVHRSRALMPERTIELSTKGIGDADEAAVDPDMLAIALGNLIDNAAKFSQKQDAICLSASLRPDALVLTVSDEGIGIPEEDIAKVGQRYFRASNSSSVFGTGLGLHIVQQVAAAHAGSLEIRNRPQRGTMVTLTLSIEPEIREPLAGEDDRIAPSPTA
ncbi:ATP-binding protein [Amorphus sp. 3PC139-8]|uniref:sensor histidine kinase n=1 Tax=Amorphus sp. 3PC139-8 TaxID=2735676 RepID=UPI00345C99DB